MSNPNIKKVIAILSDVKDEIHELLNESPDLQVRANNTLERLRNSFAHVSGEKMHFATDKKPATRREPLTHIAGKKFEPKKTRDIAEAEPSDKEMEDFEGYIEQVYNEFITDDAKALLAGANPMVINAVAKRAGLRLTSNQTIDVAFIERVKAAILKKEESKGNSAGKGNAFKEALSKTRETKPAQEADTTQQSTEQ